MGRWSLTVYVANIAYWFRELADLLCFEMTKDKLI